MPMNRQPVAWPDRLVPADDGLGLEAELRDEVDLGAVLRVGVLPGERRADRVIGMSGQPSGWPATPILRMP
jgi:hypothetical protein